MNNKKNVSDFHYFFSFVLFLCFFCGSLLSAPLTAETSLMADADSAFAEKKYAAARETYQRAREEFQRTKQHAEWARTTAQIIRASVALGDDNYAISEYFNLCRVEPNRTSLDIIPLPWFVPLNSRIFETAAENWLDVTTKEPPSPAAVLLAAAVLSVSQTNSKQLRGRDLLRTLAGSFDAGKIDHENTTPEKIKTKDVNQNDSEHSKYIALLAHALLWRATPTAKKSDLPAMQRIIDQLPESLQAGPLFWFAHKAALAGEHETAVIAWMRIPILYPENQPLAKESLEQTAKSLIKLNRPEQAETVKNEARKLDKIQK
ncbi:MAG: hypothetical protein ACRCUY_11015 [Thermoguttaceae bacterium]